MFKGLKNWLKKKAFKWGASVVEDKLEVFESKNERIAELRFMAYTLPMDKFAEWLIKKWAVINGVDASAKTLPQHIKDVLDPVRDDIEEPIEMFIDVLDPRN